MYTCIEINHEGRNALVTALKGAVGYKLGEFFFQTPRGEPLPHHVTLNLGALDPKLNDPGLLWKDAEVVVDAFFLDRQVGVCAARVVEARSEAGVVKSMNENPHITMCLKQGVKPVASNQIEWGNNDFKITLPEPIRVRGVIRECE